MFSADKLHNLTSISQEISDGTMDWNRFNAGKEKQKWYYGEIISELSKSTIGVKFSILLEKEFENVFLETHLDD